MRNRRRVLQRFFGRVIDGETTVLDVGCGLSIDLVQLGRKAAFSMGIDIDKSDILYSKEKIQKEKLNEKACLVIADAHYLPLKDESFDIVTCFDVLEHLKKPWHAVKELFRVSKRFIAVASPTDRSVFHQLYYRLTRFQRRDATATGGHVQWFYQRLFLGFLRKFGIVIKVYGIYNIPLPPFAIEHSRFKKSFEHFDRLLGQTPMKVLAFTTVIILQKYAS